MDCNVTQDLLWPRSSVCAAQQTQASSRPLLRSSNARPWLDFPFSCQAILRVSPPLAGCLLLPACVAGLRPATMPAVRGSRGICDDELV